jgi:hypothetical protein
MESKFIAIHVCACICTYRHTWKPSILFEKARRLIPAQVSMNVVRGCDVSTLTLADKLFASTDYFPTFS